MNDLKKSGVKKILVHKDQNYVHCKNSQHDCSVKKFSSSPSCKYDIYSSCYIYIQVLSKVVLANYKRSKHEKLFISVMKLRAVVSNGMLCQIHMISLFFNILIHIRNIYS